MNVFFIYFFAFFVNIHFYQALFIKYRSVENLNLFSQSDYFLGYLNIGYLNACVFVLSRHCTRTTAKHGQLHVASFL